MRERPCASSSGGVASAGLRQIRTTACCDAQAALGTRTRSWKIQPLPSAAPAFSASDAALCCGAELIVHAYPDGRAPGCERLVEMGLRHSVVPAAGTSEDVAMLMAYEKGAELIVSVGAHFNLIEFLERKRGGMSSTFLTRLRIGEKLVDAKGVSRLYQPTSALAPALLFAVAFLVLLTILIITSPALNDVFELFWLKVRIWLGL